MLDGFGVRNRADRGRTPGRARTSEVALEPVGISTILVSLEGVRGVAYDLALPVPDPEELDPEVQVPPM